MRCGSGISGVTVGDGAVVRVGEGEGVGVFPPTGALGVPLQLVISKSESR